VSLREIARGLVLWIALREPGFCWLEAIGPGADEQPVPRLYVVPGKYRSAPGVFESTAAAFLTREPGADASAEAGAFEVHVRGVGGAEIAERLRAHVQAWDAAGRPGSEGLRIRAMPIDRAYTPAANEHVVEKRWTRLVLDWDRARAVTSTSP
jgi:protein-L-isoaspartate(D-aspartate) O-methyltransferase